MDGAREFHAPATVGRAVKCGGIARPGPAMGKGNAGGHGRTADALRRRQHHVGARLAARTRSVILRRDILRRREQKRAPAARRARDVSSSSNGGAARRLPLQRFS